MAVRAARNCSRTIPGEYAQSTPARICIGVVVSLAFTADEQCSPLHTDTHPPVVVHDSQGTRCASHMRQNVGIRDIRTHPDGLHNLRLFQMPEVPGMALRAGPMCDAKLVLWSHRPLRGAFRSGRTRRVTKYDLIGHSPRSPPRRPCTRVGAAIGRPHSTQLFPHHPGRIRTIHPDTDLHRRCGIAGLYRGRAMLAPTHRYAPGCAKCGDSRASWPKAVLHRRPQRRFIGRARSHAAASFFLVLPALLPQQLEALLQCLRDRDAHEAGVL